MTTEITIQVIAKSNTGKTTISQEIVDLLRELKFNVEWDISPDHSTEYSPRRLPSDQLDRLNAIRQKEPKIIIKEVQAREILKH